MTITQKQEHVRILEILLCPSVLFGYNDCIIAIPLGKEAIDKKSLHFQGLYLSLNETSVIKPSEINSSKTMQLDCFDDGLLYVKVVRYYVQDGIQNAVIRISANDGEIRNKVTSIVRDQLAVFAFQYSFKII